MTRQRHFPQRRVRILLVILAAAAFFSATWFLTHLIGVPHVRSVVAEGMRFPPDYTEVRNRWGDPKGEHQSTGRFYYCSAEFYAPLLVRVDQGSHRGRLSGKGDTALYLWLFGPTFRILELESWVE